MLPDYLSFLNLLFHNFPPLHLFDPLSGSLKWSWIIFKVKELDAITYRIYEVAFSQGLPPSLGDYLVCGVSGDERGKGVDLLLCGDSHSVRNNLCCLLLLDGSD